MVGVPPPLFGMPQSTLKKRPPLHPDPAPRAQTPAPARDGFSRSQGHPQRPRTNSTSVLPNMLQNLRLGRPAHRDPQRAAFKPSNEVVVRQDDLFVSDNASLGDVPLRWLMEHADDSAKLTGGGATDGSRMGNRLVWKNPGDKPRSSSTTDQFAKAVLTSLVRKIPLPEDPPTTAFFYERPRNEMQHMVLVRDLDDAIAKCLQEIQQAPELTPTAVRGLLKPVAERMHRAIALSMPAAPRQPDLAPPRPMADCLAHWIDALDQSRAELPVTSIGRRSSINSLLDMAKKTWVSHLIDANGVCRYFGEVGPWCAEAGLADLASLASRLHEETDRYLGVRSLAAENDNPMKRAWESALVRSLVKDPPPEVLGCAHQVGRHMAARIRYVVEKDRDSGRAVVAEFRRLVQNDPRFWTPRVPRLKSFIDAAENKQKRRLLEYLEASPTTGEECLSLYYSTVKLSSALQQKAKRLTPWGQSEADREEYRIRDDARRIIKGSNQLAAGSGILLAHQPPMRGDPYANVHWYRPALSNHPDLADPSPMIDQSLAAGAPYVSGPSGSAAFILGAVDHMINRERGQISRRQAMLGTLMFLTYDGGHSLHEVMWALNLIKPRIDTRLTGPHTESSAYRSDYEEFFKAFPDSTQPYLARARENAFAEMIDYRRQLVRAARPT